MALLLFEFLRDKLGSEAERRESTEEIEHRLDGGEGMMVSGLMVDLVSMDIWSGDYVDPK